MFAGVKNPVMVHVSNDINSLGLLDIEVTLKGWGVPQAWKTVAVGYSPQATTERYIDLGVSPFFVGSAELVVRATDATGETIVARRSVTVLPSWVTVTVFGLSAILAGLAAYIIWKKWKLMKKVSL